MISHTQAYIRDVVIPGANALLPEKMRSRNADLLLLAIGQQESRFLYRKQIGGPARGFWQFETAGIQGVLSHSATRDTMLIVLKALQYDFTIAGSHEAVMHNDVLACVYARLLLWSDPKPLPSPADVMGMWDYYVRNWRPGKPKVLTWPISHAQALEIADGHRNV